MVSSLPLLVLVIILALAFDYINGFHDTANAVATVVSTNVLPGRTAVLMAATFNFVGASGMVWTPSGVRCVTGDGAIVPQRGAARKSNAPPLPLTAAPGQVVRA